MVLTIRDLFHVVFEMKREEMQVAKCAEEEERLRAEEEATAAATNTAISTAAPNNASAKVNGRTKGGTLLPSQSHTNAHTHRASSEENRESSVLCSFFFLLGIFSPCASAREPKLRVICLYFLLYSPYLWRIMIVSA